jgi:hypothetical protein
MTHSVESAPPLTSAPSPSARHTAWRGPRTADALAVGLLLWSLVTSALGVYWARGGRGFPLDPCHVPRELASPLATSDQGSMGWWIATAGVCWAALAAAMLHPPHGRCARQFVSRMAWGTCVFLMVVVPDARALAAAAYAPIFLVGAPFGWPPARYGALLPWPVAYLLLCMIAGLAWGAAAVAFRRATGDSCAHCGRGWTSGLSFLAHGWPARAAVAVAVVVPLCYATVRMAWFLGIPLGVSEAVLRAAHESEAWSAAGALAMVNVAGALLTLGLVRPWGERFPRWIPGMGGRPVPPLLPLLVALPVATLVTSAGIGAVRLHLADGFGPDGWGGGAPALLWPLWGVALAAAAAGYYERQRRPCAACGASRWPRREPSRRHVL